jgi:hypothetical protein
VQSCVYEYYKRSRPIKGNDNKEVHAGEACIFLLLTNPLIVINFLTREMDRLPLLEPKLLFCLGYV